MSEMKKQLDARWRQLDKFEASVRTIAEAKSAWRKKLSAKEGEAEALKVPFVFFRDLPRLMSGRNPSGYERRIASTAD
jgi:hypothetical protein